MDSIKMAASAGDDEGIDVDDYTCETCDRDFEDVEMLREHLSQHARCGIDGCTFEAHQLVVMAHVKAQHSTGLYDKIRNVSTPEDIERWRAERKRNYPSKEKIEERYKAQAEMLKTGKRVRTDKERFVKIKEEAREKRLLAKKKRIQNRRMVAKKHAAVSLIDEKADWNGTMYPFRGTKMFDEVKECEAFSDEDEWVTTREAPPKEEMKLNSALGALIGAYGSDEDDAVDPIEKNAPTNDEIAKPVCSDDELIEEKSSKTPVDLPDKASELIQKPKPVKNLMNKTTRKKRQLPVVHNEGFPLPAKRLKLKRKAPVQQRPVKRKATLLEKLLAKEIREEKERLAKERDSCST